MSDRTAIEVALGAKLPAELLKLLLDAHSEMVERKLRGDLEPSELNAGKFVEAAFRVLEAATQGGTYTPLGTQLGTGNLIKTLENLPTGTFDDGIRIHIPRTLRAIYDVRNKRGGGHLSGGVSPNRMDSSFVCAACDWVLAELIRLFHGCSTDEAQSMVDALAERRIPLIWQTGNTVRCLNPSLKRREQVLAILYALGRAAGEEELRKCVEYSNKSMFRSKVLGALHKERLVEWNREDGSVCLSPKGQACVEQTIPFEVG